jgi:recombination protein RecA
MDKTKAIGAAVSQIEKQYGKGSIMRMGDEPPRKVASISTGALALDLALGVGGVPRGRVIEIYGPESSGKTTLALHVIAETQRAGGLAAFIDAEHALDPTYAEAIGVDLENLYFSQPDNGEQALEIADTLVRSGALDLVVVDSVARLMSQALRKLSGSLSRSGTTAIFINQLREKIGVMFGSPETTPGGRALKFYSSVRLDIRRIGALKAGNDTVGNQTRVKVVKNKVAPPFKVVEFDIMYGEGISKEGSLLDIGIENNVIQKSGAWFAYGDERLGQGRENAKQFLKENDEVRGRILADIYEKLGFVGTDAAPNGSLDGREDGAGEPAEHLV